MPCLIAGMAVKSRMPHAPIFPDLLFKVMLGRTRHPSLFYGDMGNLKQLVRLPKFNKMGIIKQVAEYLYLRKKDPDAPRTQWMKYMHGINRISILLFLFALLVILLRRLL